MLTSLGRASGAGPNSEMHVSRQLHGVLAAAD